MSFRTTIIIVQTGIIIIYDVLMYVLKIFFLACVVLRMYYLRSQAEGNERAGPFFFFLTSRFLCTEVKRIQFKRRGKKEAANLQSTSLIAGKKIIKMSRASPFTPHPVKNRGRIFLNKSSNNGDARSFASSKERVLKLTG